MKKLLIVLFLVKSVCGNDKQLVHVPANFVFFENYLNKKKVAVGVGIGVTAAGLGYLGYNAFNDRSVISEQSISNIAKCFNASVLKGIGFAGLNFFAYTKINNFLEREESQHGIIYPWFSALGAFLKMRSITKVVFYGSYAASIGLGLQGVSSFLKEYESPLLYGCLGAAGLSAIYAKRNASNEKNSIVG